MWLAGQAGYLCFVVPQLDTEISPPFALHVGAGAGEDHGPGRRLLKSFAGPSASTVRRRAWMEESLSRHETKSHSTYGFRERHSRTRCRWRERADGRSVGVLCRRRVRLRAFVMPSSPLSYQGARRKGASKLVFWKMPNPCSQA